MSDPSSVWAQPFKTVQLAHSKCLSEAGHQLGYAIGQPNGMINLVTSFRQTVKSFKSASHKVSYPYGTVAVMMSKECNIADIAWLTWSVSVGLSERFRRYWIDQYTGSGY